MKARHLATIATTAAMACCGIARAQSPIPESGDSLSIHKEMDEWTIYADATRGSCLAERVDPAGNVMRMGLTRDGTAGHVGVFTLARTDIRKAQPIEIMVDGQLFVGESYGLSSRKLSGGYSGGHVVVEVAAPLAGAQISLVPQAEARVGRPLTPVSVAGAARRTVRRCAVGVYYC